MADTPVTTTVAFVAVLALAAATFTTGALPTDFTTGAHGMVDRVRGRARETFIGETGTEPDRPVAAESTEPLPGVASEGMTARQEGVLGAAYRAGYFNWPRDYRRGGRRDHRHLLGDASQPPPEGRGDPRRLLRGRR